MTKALLVRMIVMMLLVGCNFHLPLRQSETSFGTEPSAELISKISFAEVSEKVFKPKCIGCHDGAIKLNLQSLAEAKAAIQAIEQVTLVAKTMPPRPIAPLTEDEVLILKAWILAGGPGDVLPDEPASLDPTFASIRENILVPKCLSCHGPGGDAHRIPLSTREDLLNSPLEIVVPGNAEESGLILVLIPESWKPMPPTDSGISPVLTSEIETIRSWINSGAVE